jgi:enamine deaminase RidA (YjgF/YER057c/UK114 family)
MATAIKPQRFPWFDYARYSFSLGVRAGFGVYLSGHTASQYDPAAGRIVVKGGMAEQVRTAYAKIGAILEAAGLSYSDVVRIVEYVRPEGIERYAEAAAIRAEVFGAAQPAVNTVPVKSLLRPDAFIEIEVTAGAAGAGPASAGLAFLPTIQPVDPQGAIVGGADVAAQTRAIFERARAMLAALSLGFDRVVKIVDYLAPEALSDYDKTQRIRSEFLGPVRPAATAVVAPRLLHPEALIQCDFIVARDAPVAIGQAEAACSPGVRCGDLLFLSGQGVLGAGAPPGGDVAAQAERAYANIIKVVEAAGGGPQHLVKTIEYVTPAGLPRYREVAAVRARLLREPFPASTGLVCEALPHAGMSIEIDPFAVLLD